MEISLKICVWLVLADQIISIASGRYLLPLVCRIVGAVLSVMGTIIFITAVSTMRDSWRAGIPKTDKTELVTTGIYQWSRNPAFLGFDLLDLGILLMFFNWVLFVLSVLAVILYHLQIVNVVEDFLLETFGKDYAGYRKKVRRYYGRKRILKL